MPKKTIEHVEVASSTVLMRVDFNVPLDDAGQITDDLRIRMALPSIKSVIDRGGRLILISHLGRPEGKGVEPSLSLKPIADRLGQLLDGAKVRFVPDDCVGSQATEAVAALSDGQVLVLENLRFDAGEKKGDKEFAAKLAALAHIYCNDAFGTAHRNDASMVAVPQAMSGKPRVAGLLMDKELSFLSETLRSPKKPFVAVLGGAKVSDKLGVLHNLMGKVDTILMGGAMSYTLLKALGFDMGSSMVQLGMLKQAQQIIDEAAASPTDLILPNDHVCGKQISRMTPMKICKDSIESGWMGLDIGPETVSQFVEEIRKAKTILWNGPMGVFETKPFDVGTKQIAEAIAQATDSGAVSIIGGGETAAAVDEFGLAERFSHISTGGGASLQMLEGKEFASVNLLEKA
ncbi:MAG: phosphoglycerate kinase [Planctomycetes bacterium]|nr:phosphoglycerate kinase [Planctomycetota bacterium]